MSAFTALPSVQAADYPLLNPCDPSEQSIAHEVLLLAIMQDIAAQPGGAQRLAQIEQCCLHQLGNKAQGEPSRIISSLIAAAQQSE